MVGSVLFEQTAVAMSYTLIIIALWISAATTLKLMVRLYQAQAWMLTVVVLVTALEPGRKPVALGLLAMLPATLAIVVPPLLARASLASGPRLRWPSRNPREMIRWIAQQREAPRNAELTWLQQGRSRLPGSVSAAIDMSLIAVAVLIAYRLANGASTALEAEVVPSLAVAIALLLQGLFTMTNKKDIISQIIGLLVVEHGLFLAAVRVAPPALAYLFVLSLFFYVLVTLTILLWILPELHRASESMEVSGNTELKG
jgi:hydrogenase-4 membrane subunit HyfE